MTNADAAGDDDFVRPDDCPDGGQTDGPCDPRESSSDDTFELELDGQVHTLPGALKGAFLRQADYTRKTQELAAHRKALETERAAMAAQARTGAGAAADQAHLLALDHQLAVFSQIDWHGLSQSDPQRAEDLWRRAEQTQSLRDDYASAIAHHESRARIEAARAAAERMTLTGQTLAREIEGWSPALAGKLVDYAQTHGVTLEELGAADDPRVWKILHRAWQADEADRRDGAAKAVTQAQAVRPAVSVCGAAMGGGVRDELATKEWMKRRNEAVRKAR